MFLLWTSLKVTQLKLNDCCTWTLLITATILVSIEIKLFYQKIWININHIEQNFVCWFLPIFFFLSFSKLSVCHSDIWIVKWFPQIESWSFVLSNYVYFVKVAWRFICMPSQCRQQNPQKLVLRLLLVNIRKIFILVFPFIFYSKTIIAAFQ